MRVQVLTLIALSVVGCGGHSEDDLPPNLALITLDTVRRDHVGAYGYFRDTTPKLDALAAESIVFDSCFAPIAHTTPSHITILTGTYPHEHGVLSNSNLKPVEEQEANAFISTPGLVSFAEHAGNRGYATAGFVSAAPLKKITGLATGFQAWGEPEGARRTATETLSEALPWLDSRSSEEPWFIWLHFFDAHGPYIPGEQPPAPYDERYSPEPELTRRLEMMGFPEEVRGRQVGKTTPERAVNLYDGSVRWLDDQLGSLFDSLRSREDWSRTAVVVVGDHGQGLGQHDYLAHGVVWEEQLAVPLFMRIPGIQAESKQDALMSTVDVLPTAIALLPDLATEEFTRQFRGTNALADQPRPPVFGMSPPKRGLTMIREDRWKYVRSEDGEELYDLASDPHELENVAASEPEVLARLRTAHEELLESLRGRGGLHARMRDESGVSGEVDPRLLEELGELGYGGEEDE